MHQATLYSLDMKPRTSKTGKLAALALWLAEWFGPGFHKYGSIRVRMVETGVYATGAQDVRGVSWVVVILPLE